MKLDTNRRNLLHKDAIEREWPSGPHDAGKKHRTKSERQAAKRELDGFELRCEYCGRRGCAYDCDHYTDDHDWQLEMAMSDPESRKIVKQYLVVDETQN